MDQQRRGSSPIKVQNNPVVPDYGKKCPIPCCSQMENSSQKNFGTWRSLGMNGFGISSVAYVITIFLLVAVPVVHTAPNTCQDAFPIELGRSHNFNSFYEEDVALSVEAITGEPNLPLNTSTTPSQCALAGDPFNATHPTGGYWLQYQIPGEFLQPNNPSQGLIDKFPFRLSSLTEGGRLAVYMGACGMLQCLEDQHSILYDPDGESVSWNAQPGILYYILVSKVGENPGFQENLAVVSAPLSAAFECLKDTQKKTTGDSELESVCTCLELPSGAVKRQCQDACHQCIVYRSKEYCFRLATTEFLGTSSYDGSVVTDSVEKCYTLGSGFSSREGTTICREDGISNYNCTLSINGQECSTCYPEDRFDRENCTEKLYDFQVPDYFIADCNNIPSVQHDTRLDMCTRTGFQGDSLSDFLTLLDLEAAKTYDDEVETTVGACRDRVILTPTLEISETRQIEIGKVTEPVPYLGRGQLVTFVLDTSALEANQAIVHCDSKGGTDGQLREPYENIPDWLDGSVIKFYENNLADDPLCEQEFTYQSWWRCNIEVSSNMTQLLVTVTPQGLLPYHNFTLECSAPEIELRVQTKLPHLAGGEDLHLPLRLENIEDATAITCYQTLQNGTAKFIILDENYDCSSTFSNDGCQFTANSTAIPARVSISTLFNVEGENISILCQPWVDERYLPGESFKMDLADCSVPDYYASLEGRDVSSWAKDELKDLLVTTHRNSLPPDGVFEALINLDSGRGHANVFSNTDTVKLIYSNTSKDALFDAGAFADRTQEWSRTALWPAERGVSGIAESFADLHNLRPEVVNVAMMRGSRIFGLCGTIEDPSTCVVPAFDGAPNSTAKDPSIWTPPEDVRGDIARALFYMELRYEDSLNLTLTDCPTHHTELGMLSQLLEWHLSDPVSEKEIERNDGVCQGWQGNRNPFVDYPELVEQFYGAPQDLQPGAATYDCIKAATNTVPDSGKPLPSDACAQLAPGDVFMYEVDVSGDTQVIGFLSMEYLPPELELYLTDNAWSRSSFETTEGVLKFTVPVPGIGAGKFFGVGRDYFGGEQWTETGDFDLGKTGDSIFLYCQRTDGSINPLFGFSNGNDWDAPGLATADYGNERSSVPDELEQVAALVLQKDSRHQYCGPYSGDKASLQADFLDPLNWCSPTQDNESNADFSSNGSDLLNTGDPSPTTGDPNNEPLFTDGPAASPASMETSLGELGPHRAGLLMSVLFPVIILEL